MGPVLESFTRDEVGQVPLLGLCSQVKEEDYEDTVQTTDIAQKVQEVVGLSIDLHLVQVSENAVAGYFVVDWVSGRIWKS